MADQSEVLRLYRLSAAQGNGEGMNAIGYKYQFGTGVAVDMDMAVRWYCKAVEHGNPRAMTSRSYMTRAWTFRAMSRSRGGFGGKPERRDTPTPQSILGFRISRASIPTSGTVG